MAITDPSTTNWQRVEGGISATNDLLQQVTAQAAAAQAAALEAAEDSGEAVAAAQAAANSAQAAEVAAGNANTAAGNATNAALAAQASAEAAAAAAGGVDNTRLLPPGGTSGQALVKGSGADYDAGWQDAGGGVENLADLTDVDVGAAIDGQALVKSGSLWVPGPQVVFPRPDTIFNAMDFLAEIESLSALSDGAAVSTWGDLGAGSAAEYAAADDFDGQPAVLFAPAGGAASEYFETLFGSLYTGKDMTVYLVCRSLRQIDNNPRTWMGFSEASENMSSSVRPYFQLAIGTYPAVPDLRVTFNSNVIAPGTYGVGVGQGWVVMAWRCRVAAGAAGAALLETAYYCGGFETRAHIADTSFDTDRFRVGTNYANFGNPGNASASNGAVDGACRFVGVHRGAHTDIEFRQVINYLKQRYGAD